MNAATLDLAATAFDFGVLKPGKVYVCIECQGKERTDDWHVSSYGSIIVDASEEEYIREEVGRLRRRGWTVLLAVVGPDDMMTADERSALVRRVFDTVEES